MEMYIGIAALIGMGVLIFFYSRGDTTTRPRRKPDVEGLERRAEVGFMGGGSSNDGTN
ncbi:hypothetical protein [Marininema halotolerans]|uniref:hypothetical protein n=1 Tax=Marininema halotolerans TaxID=1155944 RepID=UPI001595538C|nr:hypothetical protein [Marininema halotolerans]